MRAGMRLGGGAGGARRSALSDSTKQPAPSQALAVRVPSTETANTMASSNRNPPDEVVCKLRIRQNAIAQSDIGSQARSFQRDVAVHRRSSLHRTGSPSFRLWADADFILLPILPAHKSAVSSSTPSVEAWRNSFGMINSIIIAIMRSTIHALANKKIRFPAASQVRKRVYLTNPKFDQSKSTQRITIFGRKNGFRVTGIVTFRKRFVASS